jgi:hypothetical protein
MIAFQMSQLYLILKSFICVQTSEDTDSWAYTEDFASLDASS